MTDIQHAYVHMDHVRLVHVIIKFATFLYIHSESHFLRVRDFLGWESH
jgi:hypothetical protein